jgi:hypothetical protein
MLADLPSPPLHETIPDFHHTPKRFAAFREAVEADPLGRAAECREEIEYCMGLESRTGIVSDALASGEIPNRVTHNDTKINNVLFDEATGEGICVIDLDTVMPGSALYDFGDMVRTSAGHFEENEKDLSKVFVDLDRFECLVRGYLDAGRDFLTKREIDLLCFSGVLLTFECGIRFLGDYLKGDVYFKIHHPEENLDRARTQFELVRSIYEHEDAMQGIVKRYR